MGPGATDVVWLEGPYAICSGGELYKGSAGSRSKESWLALAALILEFFGVEKDPPWVDEADLEASAQCCPEDRHVLAIKDNLMSRGPK